MRGYIEDNGLRNSIILGENCDIVTLVETHLSSDSLVHIDGYKCFQHNRVLRHFRARSASGGLCILVKNSLLTEYEICVVDKSYDGIMALLLVDKKSDHSFMIISCYLPPANSAWGRNASEFFAHVLSIIYQNCNDIDAVYVTGDLNARIGNENDFIPDVDDICVRKVLDTTKNKHGTELLEFLYESKMAICNGRITPCFDNFTCIEPAKGTSVVDYFITDIENLNMCQELTVSTARELINKHCDLESDIYGVGRNIPDHSFLKLTVMVTESMDLLQNSCINGSILLDNTVNSDQHTDNFVNDLFDTQLGTDSQSLPFLSTEHEFFNRYKLDVIPQRFPDNNSLLDVIRNIENNRDSQDEIDQIYDSFCQFYHKEMKKHFKFYNLHKISKRTSKRCRKPFWNDELKSLWLDMCRKERKYVKSIGHEKRKMKYDFWEAQKLFDKNYRKTERKYLRNKVLEIENLSTNDPKRFWKHIKSLGPKKKFEIPMEVYDQNGCICYDKQRVLENWKDEYSQLFSFANDQCFDDEFLEYCKNDMENVENSHGILPGLNVEITEDEVSRIVSKLKNRKAVGIDNIPNEILKNKNSNRLLKMLFNSMFNCEKIPSQWKLAVIKPIPKNSLTDARLPLQYRGISLLFSIYKMFSTILNSRLTKIAENEKLYCEEQNGFHKNRSCLDHIYSLTSIIRNQKNAKKPTFVCFVDFEKAFDRVDRDLLFYKLRKMKIGGKLLESLKSVYSNCHACININNHCTDWFATNFGVRQGDPLSPTLFCLYINDLAEEINQCNSGIDICGEQVKILLYADDIALIADSEINLQVMLNRLHDWCRKWRLKVNINKTNVIHFRPKSQTQSNFEFKYGQHHIEYTNKYKYLGIILNEHLEYSIIAETLANSGKRALGSIYSKFRRIKGIGCNAYSKLYHTGVTPILDYCAGVWGNNKFEKIDSVQNKAIRWYLGVHSFAPNLAIQGDMGWVNSRTRRKIEMLRYWNVLIKMNESRIPRKILNWEMEKRGLNWTAEIRNLLVEVDMEGCFHNLQDVNLECIRNILCLKDKENWKKDYCEVPKLRSYVLFKSEMCLEPYVYKVINRSHRSILAQLRCGILPLKIETGRFTNVPVEFRLCLFCSDNCIEDEEHFLFHCELYQEIRESFFVKISKKLPLFNTLAFGEKFKILMEEDLIKETSEYIYKIFNIRRSKIYC